MNLNPNIFSQRLNNNQFSKLSVYIQENYGIKMPLSKKIMLEGRLHKRLKITGINTFDDYLDFLFSDEGLNKEGVHMIDVVTTNKTDFFREPHHFDFLTEKFLPKLDQTDLKIWSAGCSTGEEPYTIAITLEEYIANTPINYSIYASDLSTRVLQHASKAVYDERRIEGLPLNLKKKYFLKSKNKDLLTVRIIPRLRSKVKYERINFMDDSINVKEQFDVVFCRNVIIYFDKETQQNVLSYLCSKLKAGGILFLGHSESISDLRLPVKQIVPTVFEKRA